MRDENKIFLPFRRPAMRFIPLSSAKGNGKLFFAGATRSNANMRERQFGGASGLGERLIEIGLDVFDVLDAYREPNQLIRYAHLLPDDRRHGGVGHEGRMRNEGFDAAEAFREGAEMNMVQKVTRGFDGAKFEGNHGAEPALLTLREFMLRMRFQSRVDDAFHFAM